MINHATQSHSDRKSIAEQAYHYCGQDQLLELTDNPAIAPADILLRHTQNKVDCRLWDSRSARRFERLTPLRLPHPFAIRFRLNHMHYLRDIVVDQCPQPQKFRFLLRSWYNTADIDAGTQNPDLRLQQLKVSIVARTKPLQDEGQEREKEVFHTDTFRGAWPAQRCNNTGYQDDLHFRTPNPDDGLARPPYWVQNPGEMWQFVCHFFRSNMCPMSITFENC